MALADTTARAFVEAFLVAAGNDSCKDASFSTAGACPDRLAPAPNPPALMEPALMEPVLMEPVPSAGVAVFNAKAFVDERTPKANGLPLFYIFNMLMIPLL
jgi:hypothetical protein